MNAEALTAKLDSSSFSRNYIAEYLGITRQGLYNKLSGEREFKASEIKKISYLLGLSEREQQDIFFADCVGEIANK